MEVLGYAATVLIGITLGLTGGGGSILTVPALVYLFGISTSVATGDSLFLVGVTAVLGTSLMARRGQVAWRTAVQFVLPSFVAVFLTRHYLLPIIPAYIGQLTRDALLLIFFAALMLLTALSMLRKRVDEATQGSCAASPAQLLVPAVGVGLVTGLVGAGGGFLIVPALTLAARLPMKQAVGTSLVVIAANSLFGFFSDVQARDNANWAFLLTLATLAGVGMGIGTLLSKRISGDSLRPAFGVFLLVMGTYMVAKEICLPR